MLLSPTAWNSTPRLTRAMHRCAALLQELGNLLGVDTERAEQVGADMIQEGRLQATIDQVRSIHVVHHFGNIQAGV